MTSSFTISVNSSDKWTFLCEIQKGETYRLQASGTWKDWNTETTADGYVKAILKPFEPLRRAPDQKWFCLIGAFDQDDASAFRIGVGIQWEATRSGKLWCFANDAKFMYWNNSGAITVTGTLVG